MQEIHNSPTINQQYFCFILAKSFGTFIFCIMYLVAILIYFYFVLTNLFRMRKIGYHKNAIVVYTFLILWVLMGIAQITLNLIYYQADDKNITMRSFQIFLLVFCQTFLLNLALKISLYNWHKNILKFMYQRQKMYEKQSNIISSFRPNKNLDYFIKLLSIIVINGFSLICLVWLVACIYIYTVKSQDLQWMKMIAGIAYLIASIGSLFILIGYSVGFYSFKKNQIIEELVQQRQLKFMKRIYLTVIILSSIRFVLLFLRDPLLQTGAQQTVLSQCKKDSNGHDLLALLILAIQAIVIEFIPAIAILLIYLVPKNKKQLKSSSIFLDKEENFVFQPLL